MSQSFPTKQQQSAAAGRRKSAFLLRGPLCSETQNAFSGASEAELRECRTVSRPAVLAGAVWGGQGHLPPGAVSAGPKGPEESLWTGCKGCSLPACQPGPILRASPSSVHRQREEKWQKLSCRVAKRRWMSATLIQVLRWITVTCEYLNGIKWKKQEGVPGLCLSKMVKMFLTLLD